VIGKATSCGVIVTDGERILLGHATRSPRWDVPKGTADPGETMVAAAIRELREETGLVVGEDALQPLGVFPYRRGKDLALFGWAPSVMPDPKTLVCTSHFLLNGAELPEFDRFGLFLQTDAVARVGKAMAEILAKISLPALCGASGSTADRDKGVAAAN
jgi:8-oxo-dGTP pyrophosphatase MutT (NUDIX family)